MMSEENNNQENESWISEYWVTLSVFGTAIFVAFSIYLATLVFKSYLFSLFVITPVLSGFICSLLLNYNRKETLGNCIKASLIMIGVAMVLCMLFALEGAICILMASPILLLLSALGSSLGFGFAHFLKNRSKIPALVTVIILNPASIVVEGNIHTKPETIVTDSQVLIDAPAAIVWDGLVSKNDYSGFDNFLFKAGVAYPKSTQLISVGQKKFFTCNYSQGKIDLPVKDYMENSRLVFGFENTPAPVKELSFYQDLHLPHLHGYFNISNGQILLSKVNENQTLLTARTTYSYNIKPMFYWKVWTNYLLNKVHRQVLITIKGKAEKKHNDKVAIR